MAEHPRLILPLDFDDVLQNNYSSRERVSISGQSLAVTPVFHAYWHFAAERQNIFFDGCSREVLGSLQILFWNAFVSPMLTVPPIG
jgi:hypothetical protein